MAGDRRRRVAPAARIGRRRAALPRRRRRPARRDRPGAGRGRRRGFRCGAAVTSAAVANAAAVSTWLLYTDGLREHPDAARRRQHQPANPAHANAAGTDAPVTSVGLRTDLALARDEIRRLRADNDKLRHRLRLQLGAEIDGPDRAELITRVADLESLTRQLLAERDARAAEADSAKRRIHDLEDDLTAARESLRRVIKDHNRPQP
jgi:hypothetical protein